MGNLKNKHKLPIWAIITIACMLIYYFDSNNPTIGAIVVTPLITGLLFIISDWEEEYYD